MTLPEQNFDQTNGQTNDTQKGAPGFFGSVWLFVWDFLKIFLIALAIIVPIRYYLFQPFIVTGQSMLPNFEDGQYLIIDEISYRFSNPERGDVTVIHSPQDDSQFFIKRIIALPGETLEINSGTVKIFNAEFPGGETLDEEYLSDNSATFGTLRITMAEDQYFVLGDNRQASSDSRMFGPISRGQIIGRVFLRAFPLNKFDKFSAPEY